jgi:hypothetical protein
MPFALLATLTPHTRRILDASFFLGMGIFFFVKSLRGDPRGRVTRFAGIGFLIAGILWMVDALFFE